MCFGMDGMDVFGFAPLSLVTVLENGTIRVSYDLDSIRHLAQVLLGATQAAAKGL